MDRLDKLQEIKGRINELFNYEKASDNDWYYMKKEHIDWLIEQAEKVENAQFCLAVIKGAMDDYSEQIEELEDDLVRWESGLNQTKEMYELQRQLQQAQSKVERYEKAIKECIDRMNEGGAGTRSFVYEKLTEVMEGEE